MESFVSYLFSIFTHRSSGKFSVRVLVIRLLFQDCELHSVSGLTIGLIQFESSLEKHLSTILSRLFAYNIKGDYYS